MSRQVATAMSAGLGEVLAIWYVTGEAASDDPGPDDLRPDVVYVCESGIALGGANGERVIASGGWADVTSFRWSKLIDNSYDPRAGAVSTRISFLVSVEVDGRDACVAFESAPVVTPGTDFFARGADWPDLPDEWTLYRAEGEITAAALPRCRAAALPRCRAAAPCSARGRPPGSAR